VERGLCKAASGEGPEGDCPDGRPEEPGQKGTERLVIIEFNWFLFLSVKGTWRLVLIEAHLIFFSLSCIWFIEGAQLLVIV
jgi:hypothetical protein